ncbi:hypothetical protein TYRP_021633 [Tyrophagus putrescentiae]|nr:hypothetical protein TYRP_021633 [Tyrophagus putrescentiae]
MGIFTGFNTQLLALQVMVFCWFSAAACLMPYMSIHMRALGITVEETAFVYTILPFAAVLGSPIAGFIADKLGNYKPVLCSSLVVTVITSVALMFIPSAGDPEKEDQSPEEEWRHLWVFWLYFIIRIVFAITSGICFTLLDATSIALSEKYNTSFGRVRFWGILGTGLFSPICGWLVDRTDGQSEFESDYSPTFHFFNFFVFLTVVISIVLDIEVSAPPKNMLRNLLKLIKSPSVWILFVVIFVLGTLWGFIESFLFWYLLDLKAPKMLLGLTLTTGAVVSLPFLVTSGWFVKRCGNENLMILALVFYFIRCYGYSLIESPFWCFPFEAMEVFTYHLMWVAAAIYSAELAPEGLRATMIGAVGSLHYGIGRASGSMIGGSMMALIGARLAFRYLGIGAAVTAVFYSIYYYGYFRKTKPASTSVTEVVEKTAAKKSTQQNGASVDCKVTLTNGTPDTVKVEAAQVMQIYSVEENAKALSNIKLETIER